MFHALQGSCSTTWRPGGLGGKAPLAKAGRLGEALGSQPVIGSNTVRSRLMEAFFPKWPWSLV